MVNLNRLTDKKGFTLVEIIVASMMVAFVAAGIWGVYWSIVNTYYVEQEGATLQAEGEWLVDLMVNGGYYGGKAIYGLSAMSAVSPVPAMGQGTDVYFTDADDYRVGFLLDDNLISGKTRYAEFAVEFNGASSPTSKLYFRLGTSGVAGDDHNYSVLLTENLLQRRSGTDADAYGSYDATWFKAEKMQVNSGDSDYCSGVRLAFYLVDVEEPLQYNYRLDREPDPPLGTEDDRRKFLSGIPYPQYFSTTVYFPNRE